MKFQEEGLVVADVSLTIKTALTCIKSFAGNNGPSFHKLSNYEIIEGLVAGPTTREIYKLTGGNGELTVERQKLITKLCENLEVCFEDTTQGLIKCTSIANFRMWPDKEEELHGYGDDMIKEIVEHFENYFEDKDQILAEWPLLRNGVFEAFQKEFGNLSWQKVHRRFGNEYPHALSIFDLVLSIPATSTACERGFTHMKLIKSNQRSLLKEAQLSTCLTIKLEGSSIKDFNPDKAINLWFQKASRRPGTSASVENRNEVSQAGDISAEMDEDNQADVLLLNEPNIQVHNEGINIPDAGDAYQLVQVAHDSDYESDFDSDGEAENEIFDMIAKY